METRRKARCRQCELSQWEAEKCRRCGGPLKAAPVVYVDLTVIEAVRWFTEDPLPTVDEITQALAREALRRTDGKSLKAAAMIGVGKTTFYRWLREWGMASDATEVGSSLAPAQDCCDEMDASTRLDIAYDLHV